MKIELNKVELRCKDCLYDREFEDCIPYLVEFKKKNQMFALVKRVGSTKSDCLAWRPKHVQR